MVLFTMEFASLESKIYITWWARLEKESSQRTPRLENENKNVIWKMLFVVIGVLAVRCF